MKMNNIEHYTDCWLYQMEQTTLYCKEKGEQFLRDVNSGLTLDQFISLDILSVQPDICQMELAKAILKDRVYTSRMLNTLEEKGLVERTVETKGKSLVKRLNLTAEGKKLHLELQQELEEAYDAVFNQFTEEEIELITKGIMKLKDAVSKITIMPL